jgi:hypothetical protein
MTLTPYHTTRSAIYFKHPNGLVTVMYRSLKIKSHSIAHVSNDDDGHNFIKELKKIYGTTSFRYLYRVPNDGKPYSPTNDYVRRGSILKSRAMIISVYPRF